MPAIRIVVNLLQKLLCLVVYNIDQMRTWSLMTINNIIKLYPLEDPWTGKPND